MRLNTMQCVALIKLINKMELKKDLLDLINKTIKLHTKTEQIQKTMLRMCEEQGKEIKQIVAENEGLAIELDNTTMEIQSITIEGVFTIVEAIPRAENEVYKVVADIKDMNIKDVKEAEGSLLVDFFMDVAKSETFKRFFMTTAQ